MRSHPALGSLDNPRASSISLVHWPKQGRRGPRSATMARRALSAALFPPPHVLEQDREPLPVPRCRCYGPVADCTLAGSSGCTRRHQYATASTSWRISWRVPSSRTSTCSSNSLEARGTSTCGSGTTMAPMRPSTPRRVAWAFAEPDWPRTAPSLLPVCCAGRSDHLVATPNRSRWRAPLAPRRCTPEWRSRRRLRRQWHP
jgi:hypothetical protein